MDAFRGRGLSEYVLAYALVHGVLLWGRFADDMMGQIFKIYDDYAVNEATFIPYWTRCVSGA